tara:strand:+ start:1430 stop:2758 length:1329 start_codon:yes stop_codon:yes gene_type:complete
MIKKVVEIKNLSKEYQLGVIGRDTFYRDFQSFVSRMMNKEDPNSNLNENSLNSQKKFLALKNINLNIDEGEVVGIIGRNGAGKSTLLKLLSRITAPTLGEIKIKGKIASLLEVGTGFHGELTGRENIFLNGAINGMDITETQNQIDKIIEFSGILEKHIDTPVKRYSSGMVVKLGFSVAAFLDYDILICDEVLAVGDLEFQRRALSKVREINKSTNRTVLFVSHNMESIKNICSRVVIMNQGEITHYGNTDEMIALYTNNLHHYKNYREIVFSKQEKKYLNKNIELISISTKNKNNELSENFNIDESIFIEIKFKVTHSDKYCCCLFFYKNSRFLFQSLDNSRNSDWEKIEIYRQGEHTQVCKIPGNFFDIGEIDLNLIIFSPPGDLESSSQLVVPNKEIGVISFNINDNSAKNSSRGTYPFSWRDDSLIRPNLQWELKKNE